MDACRITVGARHWGYGFWLPLRFTRRGEALEHERFGVNSPVDCLWRISHAEHRAFPKGKYGAQTDEAMRNTVLSRRGSTVRSGEVAAFGGLKGVDAAVWSVLC